MESDTVSEQAAANQKIPPHPYVQAIAGNKWG